MTEVQIAMEHSLEKMRFANTVNLIATAVVLAALVTLFQMEPVFQSPDILSLGLSALFLSSLRVIVMSGKVSTKLRVFSLMALKSSPTAYRVVEASPKDRKRFGANAYVGLDLAVTGIAILAVQYFGGHLIWWLTGIALVALMGGVIYGAKNLMLWKSVGVQFYAPGVAETKEATPTGTETLEEGKVIVSEEKS